MKNAPLELNELLNLRNRLRKEQKFEEADAVRSRLEEKGYTVIDGPSGTALEAIHKDIAQVSHPRIALFGSGELSPTGRKVHEYLLKDMSPPVKIALLETPAGFEVNPHSWYDKLAAMMEMGLRNYKPSISIISALRSDGPQSTNDRAVLKDLINADYVHTGAGSPSYAARHLRGSLAYKALCDKLAEGKAISCASAAAIAFGRYVLPVYEIYKAGEDLHWKEGLNFFSQWDMNVTIIPHFNNGEGGAEIDTSCCYMGAKRFDILKDMIVSDTHLLCIDEQTACVFDIDSQTVTVMGVGTATVFAGNSSHRYMSSDSFAFSVLR